MSIEIANKEVFSGTFMTGCQPEVKHVNYR